MRIVTACHSTARAASVWVASPAPSMRPTICWTSQAPVSVSNAAWTTSALLTNRNASDRRQARTGAVARVCRRLTAPTASLPGTRPRARSR